MGRFTLLTLPKIGDAARVSKLLGSRPWPEWCVEILLPFVLKQQIKHITLDKAEVDCILGCFGLLVHSRRFHKPQKKEAAELLGMLLLAEGLKSILKYKEGGNCYSLSSFVMRKYQAVLASFFSVLVLASCFLVMFWKNGVT